MNEKNQQQPEQTALPATESAKQEAEVQQPVVAPTEQPADSSVAQPAEQTTDAPVVQPAEKKPLSLNPTELMKSANPADLLKVANPAELLKSAPNQPAVKVEEKIWGLVCYIPLMALLALVINPRSEFIKLHGRQGILVTLIFFFNIFVYLIPVIGIFLGMLIHFGALILGFFSAFQAFIGNWWKIPVLGSVAELLPMEAFTQVARDVSMGAKVDEMDKDAKLMGNNAEPAAEAPIEPTTAVKEEAPVENKKVEEKKEKK